MGRRGELFSARSISEKRVFFFNVKENRRGDMFLNIVESKRGSEDGAPETDRHQIIIYQEELEDFYKAMTDAVEHIKGRRWHAFKDQRKTRESHNETESGGKSRFRIKNSGDDTSDGVQESADSVKPAGPEKKESAGKSIVRKVRLRREKNVDESETDQAAE
ncbi:DUF3276 family protein [Spirochaeta dissipatitropha]